MKLYQDQENRAYSHILTTLFPEQTKTLPRVLAWSVIFMIDLVLTVAVFSATVSWRANTTICSCWRPYLGSFGSRDICGGSF